jgi:hypothetical protein
VDAEAFAPFLFAGQCLRKNGLFYLKIRVASSSNSPAMAQEIDYAADVNASAVFRVAQRGVCAAVVVS